eukprot:3216278-Amphidinium_carterae.1
MYKITGQIGQENLTRRLLISWILQLSGSVKSRRGGPVSPGPHAFGLAWAGDVVTAAASSLTIGDF